MTAGLNTPEHVLEMENLTKLLDKVRNGWEAQSHDHMEKGCRCLSCYETVGYELTNDKISAFCDEQETYVELYDTCLQELLSWEEAKAVELLFKNRGILIDLIRLYVREEI